MQTTWLRLRGKAFAQLRVVLVLLPACAWGASPAAADSVIARARTVTPHVSAYARLIPVAMARLRAARAGEVTQLEVVPGSRVHAGQRLGRLQGPEIDALLQQRRGNVQSARSAWEAAQQALQAERSKYASHLATREAVLRAKAGATRARTRLETARSALHAMRMLAMLRAPATGAVVSVAVANGQRVSPGDTVLTVLPDHHVRLRARFYDGRARAMLHVGMSGRFIPADDSAPVKVVVAGIVPQRTPDGGQPVDLREATGADSPAWTSGEAGMVVLDGSPRNEILVPTRALILDRGHWWVLVRTQHGVRPHIVVPGDSQGTQTLIEHGLVAGARVIVDNAYMRFHRDFSRRYKVQD